MSNVPVIKFLFKSEWKVLSDALSINPAYESEVFATANELVTFLANSPGGLIVDYLGDKNDLVQIASLVKLLKRAGNNSASKIFVVNASHDRQYEKAIAKLGILDVIDEKIQTKAFRFKMDFMMKSIKAQVKKNEQKAELNNSVKSIDSTKPQDKKVSDSSPIWMDPLDLEDDIWLLKSDSDCKKILSRWLIKIMGPSPYVAQWSDTNTAGVWKFEFKSENVFIYGNGAWYFRGDQKPDFIWSENIWSMTGSNFELFYKDGEKVIHRFKVKDRQLSIAKNSDYAKTKEQSIIESFDKDLVFKKELAANGGSESIEKDKDNFANLEGKGKTDSLNRGPLSGKGKTSNLSSDPLSMDLKPGENNSSTDPLTQKTETSKKSSFWKGKNEYEEEGTADLAAPTDSKTNSGPQLSMESSSDHQKHYKNHNEAQAYDAKDIGHSIKKDGVSGNLEGKSDTDEIEGHLKSPNLKKDASGDKQKKDNELSGKSSTDKLEGHLSSPESRKAEAAKKEKNGVSADFSEDLHDDKKRKEAAEKNRSAAVNENQPGQINDKADKAEREKFERQLAERERQIQAEKAGNPLTGKSSTDKIDGHLSSPNAKKDPKQESPREKELREMNDLLAGISRPDVDKLDEDTRSAQIEGKVLPLRSSKPVVAEAVVANAPADIEAATQDARVTSVIIQDALRLSCKLDDFYEETLIFHSMEKGNLDQSKPVMLNLNFNYMNKDTNLRFNANISQVDSDGEGAHYITVTVSKENAASFNSFMKLYRTRQENINLFLKTAKGF